MLLRLAHLTVTNAFTALLLPPMSDRDKDVEILVLRHQFSVLERQLGADTRVRFAPEDRALLAALMTSLPLGVLCRLRQVTDLLDGSHDLGTIAAALPSTVDQLLTPA
ncbi:hypothetical protein ACIA8R_52815 [Nonomuraea sp. NPDC051191]|uniref:hypothetical protein n=1 Tax=Nonomuraea sp. NPDC051191 TaxID=3364372 RepID=UPI0037A52E14